jgi:hypothetical protein
MGRTFLRQVAQIQPSKTFTDNLTPGSALESGSTDLESDLNAVRSQLARVLNANGSVKWYENIPSVGGLRRGLEQLATDLLGLETKKVLFRAQVLTDITVTAAQNWEVLSVASSEAPSETAAVGAGTASGAVVAVLAGDVGSHSLNEVSGVNALNPKNLVIVRDASTGDVILSGGKQVYGLLQAESGTVDGDTFSDTTKQVQISFVIENTNGDDLIACPVADIAGKTINYSYVRRLDFDSVPEQAFLSGAFIDATASVDVTLNNAIDNQSTTPATQATDVYWRIDDTKSLNFQTSDGGVSMLMLAPAVAGDEVEINCDTLDVNNVNNADFANGAVFDSSGANYITVDNGIIQSATFLRVNATGTNAHLYLKSTNGTVYLTDVYRASSNWSITDGIPLSTSNLHWNNYETAVGGELSLLEGITFAANRDLNAVVDKQSGAVTQTDRNIDWRVTDTYTWKLQTSDGGRDLVSVAPTSGGDTVAFTCDTFDVNNQTDADFLNGIKADTGGTTINVGVTAGQVDASALKVAGTSTTLKLAAGTDCYLTDGYRAGSTWSVADGIKLAASSADWSDFETSAGSEASILGGIVAVDKKAAFLKVTAVANQNITANTDLDYAAGAGNIDAALPSFAGLAFASQVDVYLNGQLMRGGVDASTNNDVYPGTTPGSGHIKFEFDLKTGDVITVVRHGTPSA